MTAFDYLASRVKGHLDVIYPSHENTEFTDEILRCMRLDQYIATPEPHHNPWTQQDAIVITYSDSIKTEGEAPLKTLRTFLRANLTGFVNGIHILPFFPWSSDDGFAVIDYLQVNEGHGTWNDISAIAGDFNLMTDLVINHCSSRSRWFDNFRKGIEPGASYFVEADPEQDLSHITRPRTSPLLRPTDTVNGEKHVWCTFSHDQVDLNFANPQVLLEFVKIIRFYLDRGAKIFRLDAVAFLWKDVSTSCINLPETHEVIRLIRTLVEHCNTEAIIITETNIPNRENISYFGNANEAHMVYNFSLPPLLLYSLVSGDATALKGWLMSMPPAQAGTAYLNFIASHDGIGLRPAEGLLSDDQTRSLAELMERNGGKISWRSVDANHMKPYELNIALWDAFKATFENAQDDYQFARFMCAHTIMFAIEGIPAIYVHSLFATTNDYQRAENTGHNRAINRHQWDLAQLQSVLEDEHSHHSHVFAALKQLLTLRKGQPAFHPNAVQFTLHLGDQIFAFWRQCANRQQSIFCINNISDKAQSVALSDINLIELDAWWDLLTDTQLQSNQKTLELAPYQCVWLSNQNYRQIAPSGE
ncbi:MAG TPA: sugar phosphorylase [Marinagarivorans sp.]